MKTKYPLAPLKGYIHQQITRCKNSAPFDVFSVTNSGGFVRSEEYFHKRVFSNELSNYKVVEPGYFAYNPSRINVGSIDYLRNGISVIVSPLYIVFKTSEELSPPYLLRYLKSPWGNMQIRSKTEGAVRDSLKFSGLEKIQIPLPPLDDQKRIAFLLGKVEALIAQRKECLQDLDTLLKSIFVEIFGNPVKNEKGWRTVSFSKIGTFVGGGTPSKANNAYWGGELPWVSPKGMKTNAIYDAEDHISELALKNSAAKKTPPKHLLIVVRGMILAHSFPVAINYVDVAINQDMKAILPNEGCSVEYLRQCLTVSTPRIMQLITTAAHGTKKFDAQEMDKLQIPLPPPALQNQFAAIVEKVERIKSLYQNSLTELENLYGVLSQKAFKGELDLSKVPLPEDDLTQIAEQDEETPEQRHALLMEARVSTEQPGVAIATYRDIFTYPNDCEDNGYLEPSLDDELVFSVIASCNQLFTFEDAIETLQSQHKITPEVLESFAKKIQTLLQQGKLKQEFSPTQGKAIQLRVQP